MLLKKEWLITNRFLHYFLLFLMIMLMGIESPAFAKDDKSDEFSPEEITVTAEKR